MYGRSGSLPDVSPQGGQPYTALGAGKLLSGGVAQRIRTSTVTTCGLEPSRLHGSQLEKHRRKAIDVVAPIESDSAARFTVVRCDNPGCENAVNVNRERRASRQKELLSCTIHLKKSRLKNFA
jgi:hypothetical protein